MWLVPTGSALPLSGSNPSSLTRVLLEKKQTYFFEGCFKVHVLLDMYILYSVQYMMLLCRNHNGNSSALMQKILEEGNSLVMHTTKNIHSADCRVVNQYQYKKLCNEKSTILEKTIFCLKKLQKAKFYLKPSFTLFCFANNFFAVIGKTEQI